MPYFTCFGVLRIPYFTSFGVFRIPYFTYFTKSLCPSGKYNLTFRGSTVHTQNEITFSKEKVPLNPQEQPLVCLKCPISTFAEIWGLFCVEKNVIFALINKNIIWKMQS